MWKLKKKPQNKKRYLKIIKRYIYQKINYNKRQIIWKIYLKIP